MLYWVKIRRLPSGPLEIDVDLIEPNPEQPRTQIRRCTSRGARPLDQGKRRRPADRCPQERRHGTRSLRVNGDGGRRKRRNLRRIPAIVKDIPDEKLLELALVENIQRQELNAIEEANAYRKLIDHIGLTQEMVAERVGKDRTLIATSIRLLETAERCSAANRRRKSFGRPRPGIADDRRSEGPASRGQSAVDMGLSVRETEKAVKRACTERYCKPLRIKRLRSSDRSECQSRPKRS